MIDNVGAVPQDTSKFGIQEFVVVTIMMQIKLERQLSNIGTEDGRTLESTLETFLDSAKHIPFNLNGVIINLLTKVILAQEVDRLVQEVTPLEKNGTVESGYILETSEFDPEEIGKLEEIIPLPYSDKPSIQRV